MSEKTKNLTAKQESAIICMLTLPTVEAVASSVGVDARTIYRWRKDPEFANMLRIARSTLLESATTKLRNTAFRAVQTLEDLLSSEDETIRCRAATAILAQAYKAAETEDITERLSVLEEMAQKEPRN